MKTTSQLFSQSRKSPSPISHSYNKLTRIFEQAIASQLATKLYIHTKLE